MRAWHGQLLPTFAGLMVLMVSPVQGLQCKFKLAPYHYDLCPLFFTTDSSLSLDAPSPRRIHLHKDMSTPPTVTRNAYEIDLGGEGIKKDPTLPATEQVRATSDHLTSKCIHGRLRSLKSNYMIYISHFLCYICHVSWF